MLWCTRPTFMQRSSSCWLHFAALLDILLWFSFWLSNTIFLYVSNFLVFGVFFRSSSWFITGTFFFLNTTEALEPLYESKKKKFQVESKYGYIKYITSISSYQHPSPQQINELIDLLLVSRWAHCNPLVVLVHPYDKGAWEWVATPAICLRSLSQKIHKSSDNVSLCKNNAGKYFLTFRLSDCQHTLATSEVSAAASVLLKHIFRLPRRKKITAPMGLAHAQQCKASLFHIPTITDT